MAASDDLVVKIKINNPLKPQRSPQDGNLFSIEEA
jgi:hypothetical protein